MAQASRIEGIAGGSGRGVSSGVTRASKVSNKKSSPATLKEASKKQTGKMTATKRGFSKDKASRKEMKMQDVFYARAGKADLKAGERTGASNANVSKSQSPSKIKVPVKKVGKK